jgi:hypothetical protein
MTWQHSTDLSFILFKTKTSITELQGETSLTRTRPRNSKIEGMMSNHRDCIKMGGTKSNINWFLCSEENLHRVSFVSSSLINIYLIIFLLTLQLGHKLRYRNQYFFRIHAFKTIVLPLFSFISIRISYVNLIAVFDTVWPSKKRTLKFQNYLKILYSDFNSIFLNEKNIYDFTCHKISVVIKHRKENIFASFKLTVVYHTHSKNHKTVENTKICF